MHNSSSNFTTAVGCCYFCMVGVAAVRDFGRFPGREREKRVSIQEKGVFFWMLTPE